MGFARARLVLGPATGTGCRYHGLGDRNRAAASTLPRADDAGDAATRLPEGAAMSDALQRILKASQPLTLSGVPAGFLPWLAGDLARAAHGTGSGGRAVVI